MFFSESTCAPADEDAARSAAKTVTRPNRTDIEPSLSTTRCPSTADCGRGVWRIMSHPRPFDNGRPSTVGAVCDRTIFLESREYARSQTAPTVWQLRFPQVGGPVAGTCD